MHDFHLFKKITIQKAKQPPAKAGGLVLRTESPDTSQRPVAPIPQF